MYRESKDKLNFFKNNIFLFIWSFKIANIGLELF